MSQLPPHANLEHLKKQAKTLLAELQRNDPSSKLSDALHTIAREYGFASWPKLVEHVESTPPRAKAGVNPLAGVWIADLARSQPHPANPFRSARVTIEVDGDVYTISQSVVGASGREERASHVIQIDGVERALESSGKYLLTAKRIASRTFEAVARADGAIVGRTVYELSPDAKTLTVSARHASANAAGWQSDYDQVVVFARDPASEAHEPR